MSGECPAGTGTDAPTAAAPCGGGTTFEFQDAADVNGVFTVTSGTVDMNGNSLFVAGDFTLDTGAVFTKSTNGTVYFDGSTNFTDSSATGPQNLGSVRVD